MDNKIKPIRNSKNLCWKCLKHKTHINVIEFGNLGYGSSFDGWGSRIQLCDHCYQESNPKIWDTKIFDERNIYGGHYKYEDKMWGYINNLPIQSRELCENKYCFGWNADHIMNAQDWIDYQLDILPHEKCKKYHLYSPDEIKAYNNRFPTCNKVYKEIFPDGSSGCRCSCGAHGNSDGSCGLNISDECYMCIDYEIKADKEMKSIDISEEDMNNEIQHLQNMLKYATEHLYKLKRGK
jgi:hypothetical protein